MTPRDAWDVLRRWRSLVVAGVVIGIVVGWLSAPGTSLPDATFRATHTLILEPDARGTFALEQAPAVATKGAVPDRVAARLRLDPHLVRSSLSAEAPRSKGVLLITARSRDRAQAEALADVTAEELLVELGSAPAPLRTLERAVASPLSTDDVKAPGSRPGRALLLGAFGLLVGIGGAFGVDRFDNRIRSKSDAEEALGAPILTEVPRIPRSDRGRILAGPQSLFIEAFRGLRPVVDWWAQSTVNGDGHRLIVVSSPTGREGTTTTVAHLAAVLGETGRSVIAISADLRHPRLHVYFDRPREPGLADVLRGAPDVRQLTDLNVVTTIRGVRCVSSGAPVRNPSPLLEHIGEHLRAARSLGDVVLVDAPPLLPTSDGAEVARHADGVLLVVRTGQTTVGAAARSAELLRRLSIPLIGAVLVASERSAARM